MALNIIDALTLPSEAHDERRQPRQATVYKTQGAVTEVKDTCFRVYR